MEYRFATILAAEVDTHSTLLEHGNLDASDALSTVFDQTIRPAIADNQGRVVELKQSSILVVFNHPAKAVECARVWQNQISATEHEPAISFRIGISLGDMTIARHAIISHGVEVARGLQRLADSDGICISKDIYDSLESSTHSNFEDMGKQNLINIAELIHTYSSKSDAPATLPHDVGNLALPLSSLMPSVTLHPLKPTDSLPEMDDLCEKLTDILRVALSHFEEFQLLEPDEENQANYSIHGSFTAAGGKTFIKVNLNETSGNREVWSQNFEHELETTPSPDDDFITIIASTVGIAVLADQGRAIEHRPPDDLDLNEMTIRGMQHLQRLNPEDNRIARSYFDRVISKKPTDPIPVLGLCFSFANELANGWRSGRTDTLDYALTLAGDLVRRNPDSSHGQRIMSCLLLLGGDFAQGLQHAEKAYELNPYSSDMVMILGLALTLNGQASQGLSKMERCVANNHYSPVYFYVYLSLAYYLNNNHVEGLKVLDGIDSKVGAAGILKITHLTALDRKTESLEIANALLKEHPGFKIGQLIRHLPFTTQEQRSSFAAVLSSATLPE